MCYVGIRKRQASKYLTAQKADVIMRDVYELRVWTDRPEQVVAATRLDAVALDEELPDLAELLQALVQDLDVLVAELHVSDQ